jgi:hypothetical protein
MLPKFRLVYGELALLGWFWFCKLCILKLYLKAGLQYLYNHSNKPMGIMGHWLPAWLALVHSDCEDHEFVEA